MSNPLKLDSRSPDTGLLLVGHGTRDAAGVAELLELARLVAEEVEPRAVEPCFLELARPSIAEGFARLADRGVRRIVVAPVILFAAGHVRRDIPHEVARLAAEHPGIACTQTEHLGCHPALVELSQRRYEEALAGGARAARRTALVMVGRGSHDREATAEMLQFARCRAERNPGVCTRTGFLAMASPPLEQVLEQVAAEGFERVVVQPHLLFAGELLERVGRLVAQFDRQHVGTDWVVAPHLGPERLVVAAILDRAGASLSARLPPASS